MMKIFVLVIVGLLAVGAGASAQVKPSLPPNIIFIVADDMGSWALGANTGANAYTPVLDSLANSGVLLRNCFSNGAVCSPSRAGLISGRYPSETGVNDIIPQNKPGGLSLNLPTIPGLLKENGYRTALVGKWHLGEYLPEYLPKARGYDFFTGFPHGGMQSKSPRIMIEDSWETAEGAFTEDLLTDHAIRYLDQLNPDQTGKPFFLSLHFWAPHANVSFPKGEEPSYKGRSWLPLHAEDSAIEEAAPVVFPEPDFPDLDKPLLERMMKEYRASVHSVDRNVGRLLDHLKNKRLDGHTIIIFTSDHGYMLGHHGLWHKGSGWWLTTEGKDPSGAYGGVRPNLYDHALRVPAIVSWPQNIGISRVINEQIEFTDWFPTILEMADVEVPKGVKLRGNSILPLLKREKVRWDNDLYAEYKELRTYRTPFWKLVWDFSREGKHEFYDLGADPGEKKNVFYSSNKVIVKQRRRLERMLFEKMREIDDPLLRVL